MVSPSFTTSNLIGYFLLGSSPSPYPVDYTSFAYLSFDSYILSYITYSNDLLGFAFSSFENSLSKSVVNFSWWVRPFVESSYKSKSLISDYITSGFESPVFIASLLSYIY